MTAAVSPLQELSAAASAAESFAMRADFELPDGAKLTVRVSGAPHNSAWAGSVRSWKLDGSVYPSKRSQSITDPAEAFNKIVTEHPKAVVQIDSVRLTLRRGPATAAELRPLAVRAWCEALGVSVPTTKPAAKPKGKSAKTTYDAEVAALLSMGPAGVTAWNERPPIERSKVDLRCAPLSGRDLSGVNLAGVKLGQADLSGAKVVGAKFAANEGAYRVANLQGANLSGADLTDATLHGVKCLGVDFRRAVLARTQLEYAGLAGADFTGANLAGTQLRESNLCGADFTDAELTDSDLWAAKFDEHTRWPAGFEVPVGAKWAGAGADPRVAKDVARESQSKPADFAEFFERLKKFVAADRLERATSMLKAEKFKLFAKVEPTHLIGVVRSQS